MNEITNIALFDIFKAYKKNASENNSITEVTTNRGTTEALQNVTSQVSAPEVLPQKSPFEPLSAAAEQTVRGSKDYEMRKRKKKKIDYKAYRPPTECMLKKYGPMGKSPGKSSKERNTQAISVSESPTQCSCSYYSVVFTIISSH